jgi:hypothetical protein
MYTCHLCSTVRAHMYSMPHMALFTVMFSLYLTIVSLLLHTCILSATQNYPSDSKQCSQLH